MTDKPSLSNIPAWLIYALLTLGAVVLALIGYAGYALYPRFDLPAVQGIGLILLAVAAGIASFFSPCSFPLLVTLLARHTGIDDKETQYRASLRAFGFAGALALGASILLLLTGLLIAAGGSALLAGLTFTSTTGQIVRSMVGIFLIVLGLMQLDRIPFSFDVTTIARPLMRAQSQMRRRQPFAGFALLGFAYPLAGFG